jgi:very-short-patch-repair endonuclease
MDCKYGGNGGNGRGSLCDNDDCSVCFTRSFASSDKAKFWSKRNVLIPRQVCKCSGKKFWFDCDDCKHEFEKILLIIFEQESWCPFCANQRLCEDENCETCFEKSFASVDKAIFWSDKNKLLPRQVFKNTRKKFWFSCNKCEHEFEIRLYVISGQGGWCQFCSGKKLCENKNCMFCWNKSFASSPRAPFWSKKNLVSPRQVSKFCYKKFWFDCENGHEFQITLRNLSSLNRWCHFCRRKTEHKLYKLLLKSFPDVSYQQRFDWCKGERDYPFDFYIPSLNLIIELDGQQHFEQVSHWTPPDDARKIDMFKMNKALDHGISIIRLYQAEVYSNSFDYEKFANLFLKRKEFVYVEFVSDTNVYDVFYEEEDYSEECVLVSKSRLTGYTI